MSNLMISTQVSHSLNILSLCLVKRIFDLHSIPHYIHFMFDCVDARPPAADHYKFTSHYP